MKVATAVFASQSPYDRGAVRLLVIIAILVALTFECLPCALGQQSKQNIKPGRGFAQAESTSEAGAGRRIIITIGIDKYNNWPQLKTAVSDAREFARLLTDKFGFQTVEKELLDQDATKESIVALFEDRLRRELNKDDNVIIFFAGHGTTRNDEIGGETGYLVPVGAAAPGSNERWNDYVPMDQLLESIGKLPARHILVILDSCHSGFALGKSMQLFRDAPRYERDLTSHISRKVITSARQSQLASDNGPVPNHSLFTGLLLQGLEWGKADLDGNGVVTSSELGLYIQQAVGTASASQQTPDFGSFYFDDRGEMVVPLDDHTYTGLKSRAFGALRWAEYQHFRQLVTKVAELRPDSPETLYLQYRLELLDKHIDNAAKIIQRLTEMDFPPGQIPLSKDDLWNLRERLPYWKPVLVLPEDNFPLSLLLDAGPDESNLTAVTKVKLGDTTAYPVRRHDHFFWNVNNPTAQPLFLYALAIDQDGRLFPFSPWKPGSILLRGLEAGGTQRTVGFRQDGELEMQEFHFIASPRQLYSLLSPVSTATRGISLIEDDLGGATQKIERYTTMDLAAHQQTEEK